ncbi:hypothetical protein MKEN_00283300 [Mycena kentingensis (nom. inval.)]|nr:hypothetical protein MKEN_00283300 [Mycena kentingensis (nom. inval.)]
MDAALADDIYLVKGASQQSTMDLTAQVLSQLLAEMELANERMQRTPPLDADHALYDIHAPAARSSPLATRPISSNYRSPPPRYARTPTELMKLLNRRPASTHRLAPLVIATDIDSSDLSRDSSPEVRPADTCINQSVRLPVVLSLSLHSMPLTRRIHEVFDILELYTRDAEIASAAVAAAAPAILDIPAQLHLPRMETPLPAPIPIRRAMHAELAVLPYPLPLGRALPMPTPMPVTLPPPLPALPLSFPPPPPPPQAQQRNPARTRTRTRVRTGSNDTVSASASASADGGPYTQAQAPARGLQRSASLARDPRTGRIEVVKPRRAASTASRSRVRVGAGMGAEPPLPSSMVLPVGMGMQEGYAYTSTRRRKAPGRSAAAAAAGVVSVQRDSGSDTTAGSESWSGSST